MKKPENQFTKNQETGEWDVKGPDVYGASEGDTILVTKASGETQPVVIHEPAFSEKSTYGVKCMVAQAAVLSSAVQDTMEPRDVPMVFNPGFSNTFRIKLDDVRTLAPDLTDEQCREVIDITIGRLETDKLSLLAEDLELWAEDQYDPPPADTADEEREDLPF